jgi:hypothetical protein
VRCLWDIGLVNLIAVKPGVKRLQQLVANGTRLPEKLFATRNLTLILSEKMAAIGKVILAGKTALENHPVGAVATTRLIAGLVVKPYPITVMSVMAVVQIFNGKLLFY